MAPDANESQSTPTASDPVPNVHRDKTHYHPTGDCIIRVQSTLFKIHKFHLVHNSTVFADMFNLPSGGQQEERLSDDSPIMLQGLSAADFRFVLKYMYAGAISMQIDAILLSALREIIAVAEFADKYEMTDLNKWALSYISRRVFVPPPAKRKAPLMGLPEPDLAALHGLYRRLDVEVGSEYQDLIMDAWIIRIENDTLPIATALRAAEASEAHSYMAQLYCVQLGRFKDRARMLSPTPFASHGIPPVHMQRILAGYCSLSLAWDRLRDVNTYPRQQRGYLSVNRHNQVCLPLFQKRWKEAVCAAERRFPEVIKMRQRLAELLRCMRKYTEVQDGKKWERFVQYYGSQGGLTDLKDGFFLVAHFFPDDGPWVRKSHTP
ncbi:hypothetical protein DFH08DRAFT_386764 [Mycena albidolilacea]|uniref:BTB domain-containing protein n=1 Tax=Mycena albidolilacea TaxID=1033008 RepID=A0AAD7EFW1_9AGAR|nr:hypothetical protein DFH08DRAFT_386764 [Mycena albidolilacea]